MVCASPASPSPRRRFLQLLPAIIRHAKYAFRHLKGEARQDAIQEIIANAFVAFVALVRCGRMSLAYSTPLAKFAVAQFNDGRRVGSTLNCSDVLSPYAQRLKGLIIERLDHREKDEENQWKEAIVEDTRTPVLDQVAFRCDYPDWLDSLKRRDRRMAEYLSLGNRTSDAARKFHVSQGRVSQLRRELSDSWKNFTSFNEGNAA